MTSTVVSFTDALKASVKRKSDNRQPESRPAFWHIYADGVLVMEASETLSDTTDEQWDALRRVFEAFGKWPL